MIQKNLILALALSLSSLAFIGCSSDDSSTTEIPAVVEPGGKETVSGAVSGIWKKNSVITVDGDIIIEENSSLTIEEGVKIYFNTARKPEVIVKGNLYCEGTAGAPIEFTIADEAKKSEFGENWGGILAGPTAKEIVLNYVILEQGGAVTTDQSTSVKMGLYKAESGNAVPALWYGGDGKIVVMNSIIRNFNDDAFYLEGGDLIISNNQFYTTGVAGGEAINTKSGVYADISHNLIYSPNTNAIKLSNAGDKPKQSHIVAYNNTILNAGWRRPTIKGGSIWLEKAVRADLYNNLLVNNRFGIKRDLGNPEDQRSVFKKTFYYGQDQTCVDNFQPSEEIVGGQGDRISTVAKANDPEFVNYPLETAFDNSKWNAQWNFSLKANSPALNGADTNFTRHFASGLVLNGKTYTSPAPSSHFGAFGVK